MMRMKLPLQTCDNVSTVHFGTGSVSIHRASGHQAEARVGSLQACISRAKWSSPVGDGDQCSQQPMANGLADPGSPSFWITSALCYSLQVKDKTHPMAFKMSFTLLLEGIFLNKTISLFVFINQNSFYIHLSPTFLSCQLYVPT